ncbi:MAG TPA: sensor domain-containing diguanylate cyclase [Solimonas sp.]|nr:sensor domain-containing diguanylate cyclase [Solimonas sp.]
MTRGEPRDEAGDFDPAHHEALLRSQPERYADMVRTVTAFGIYLMDRDGLVQSWNVGAANITGFEEREIVGQHFSLLLADSAQREGVALRNLSFAASSRHCRDEHRRRKRGGGEEFHALSTLDAIRDGDGSILGFVEVFHDISEQKAREDRLYQRATRDPLTGVFNRGHFTEAATQEIERARRFAEPLSLVMIDIDHFKKVNDTYGHETGDHAIVSLAQTCTKSIRKIDTLARIGGEEFAILLPRANKNVAYEMAQRLRLKLADQRITVGEKEISYTVSMGVSTLLPTTRDLAELLRHADAALYQAKREGRNRVISWFE